MNTVSALCATSTVGAAAVGYCFGTDTPRSNKRKSFIDVEDKAPSRVRPRSNTEGSSGRAASYLRSRTSPSSHHRIPPVTAQRRRRRTRTGPEFSWDLRQSVAEITTPKIPDVDRFKESDEKGLDSVSSQSSRRSWLQRLSSHTLSQKSSPLSTPGHHTPASAPSRVSSITKLAPRNSSQQEPQPNKLVKRSASQHIRRKPSASRTISAGAYRPTLRRPATSHQRSATIQQQDLLDADNSPLGYMWSSSNQASPSSDSTPAPKYHYYFQQQPAPVLDIDSPTVNGASQRSSVPTIVASSQNGPTLLKADSTTVAEIDSTRNQSYAMIQKQRNLESDESRATPTALSNPDDNFHNKYTKERQKDARQPRRSFSIGDLLSSSSQSWLSRSPSRDTHQRFTNNKRRASAPFNGLPARVSVSAHTGSPKSRLTLSRRLFMDDRRALSRSEDVVTPSPMEKGTNLGEQSSLPSIDRLSSLNLDLLLQPEEKLPEGFSIRSPDQNHGTSLAALPSLSISSNGVRSRSGRLSMVASSERASTLVESDSDNRGFASGEDDQMSETVFDSLRTDTTNSSLGTRGPRVDRIFSESPNMDDKQDLISTLTQLTIENDNDVNVMDAKSGKGTVGESITTPRQGRRSSLSNNDNIKSSDEFPSVSSSVKRRTRPKFLEDNTNFPSLPTLNSDTSRFERWDSDDDDDDDVDDGQEEDWGHDISSGLTSKLSSPHPGRSPRPSFDQLHGSRADTYATLDDHRQPKASLFDWAEQAPADRSNSGDPRPKTMYGERATNRSGGRPLARLNALHIRSQSVPVTPEVSGAREAAVVTNRFGTWGTGSARVSEDWDNDFVFDGSVESKELGQGNENRRPDQIASMIVPQSIKESQANVIGNLGYIKEFALLVDDLKRMRSLALSKDITNGPSEELWKEADAMIELATVDDSSESLHSSSPGNASHRDHLEDEWAAESLTNRGRRKSVLSLEDDIFGASTNLQSQISRGNEEPASGREDILLLPESKNSDMSSIAISVIENIQQRRSAGRFTRKADGSVPEKLPFDTATLKNLVAHVNSLSRSLAEILRNAD